MIKPALGDVGDRAAGGLRHLAPPTSDLGAWITTDCVPGDQPQGIEQHCLIHQVRGYGAQLPWINSKTKSRGVCVEPLPVLHCSHVQTGAYQLESVGVDVNQRKLRQRRKAPAPDRVAIGLVR
jgi:hypothetical protein